MNEKEHMLLVRVGDRFWIDLSKAVARALDKLPEHMHGDALMYLQDKCSVYGSCYENYRKTPRQKL